MSPLTCVQAHKSGCLRLFLQTAFEKKAGEQINEQCKSTYLLKCWEGNSLSLLSNSIRNALVYTKPTSHFPIAKVLHNPIHHWTLFQKPVNYSSGVNTIRAYSFLRLNDLRDNKGATKQITRKGRGIGSGKGKTAGRGHKGQKARVSSVLKVISLPFSIRNFHLIHAYYLPCSNVKYYPCSN